MIMTLFRLGAPVSMWDITCEQKMTLRGNEFVFLHILAHPEGNQHRVSVTIQLARLVRYGVLT